MKIKYRIIECPYEQFRVDMFNGFWFFGKWVGVGFVFMSLESAEKYVMRQENQTPRLINNVVKEYEIKV